MRPFLAFLYLLVALATGCSEATNGVGMISQRLGEAARAPGAREVDLPSLTTFGWDRFYAFKPGVTREEVCRFFNANRNACGRAIRLERAGPDQTFMVFALQGKVTHVEVHALANGQFDFAFPDDGQPRAASVFKVRRSNTGATETVWLEPK